MLQRSHLTDTTPVVGNIQHGYESCGTGFETPILLVATELPHAVCHELANKILRSIVMIIIKWMAQSLLRLAMGSTVRGSNSGRGERYLYFPKQWRLDL